MNPLHNASVFLIQVLFDLYLFVLAMRFILALTRANYFNPFIRVIIRFTEPLVSPLRRVMPNIRRFETATLIWILIFEGLKLFLIGLIQFGTPNLLGLLVVTVAYTAKLFVMLFFYAVFLQIIVSWVQPPGSSPILDMLNRLTAPVLYPFQRIIPPISGVDISPIPALIVLQLIIIILIEPLIAFGTFIAFG